MSGTPGPETVPQRGPSYDSMKALESLQEMLQSEMGQELQKKFSEGDDLLKAVFAGMQDIRRVENDIIIRLERIENRIRK